jgi:glycerol kinase
LTADPVILAIDQGTTSCRAVVFDRHGTALGSAQRETTQQYRHPGWVEQDAVEIIETSFAMVRQVLAETGIDVGRVASIGITNQRETTVLWDRATGEAVAPAIVWQSRQTASLVEGVHQRGMAGTYQRITGLVPDAYFSATKVAWLLHTQPELRSRAERGDIAFGTVDSWLHWHLSGGTEHVTDYSNASRTMLFDIHELEWSQVLLDDLAIPASILPEVRGNLEILFDCDPAYFGRSIPVGGVAGDQQAAMFGQACFGKGEAKNTYGTGSFLLMQTGTEAIASSHRLLTTIAWGIDETVEYALEGAIFVTGAAVQWLRDGLGIIANASDVEALAASVPSSEGVSFVPAMAGLGAPYWDQGARGTLSGITRGTTSAHLARATLEAIAFQTRDVIVAMEADSDIALEELKVDGGASANDLLMQIQADVLGVPVVRPTNVETTVLGAAYLSGIASGVWESREDVRETWKVDRRFEPALNADERQDAYHRWQQAVARSRSDLGSPSSQPMPMQE